MEASKEVGRNEWKWIKSSMEVLDGNSENFHGSSWKNGTFHGSTEIFREGDGYMENSKN